MTSLQLFRQTLTACQRCNKLFSSAQDKVLHFFPPQVAPDGIRSVLPPSEVWCLACSSIRIQEDWLVQQELFGTSPPHWQCRNCKMIFVTIPQPADFLCSHCQPDDFVEVHHHE